MMFYRSSNINRSFLRELFVAVFFVSFLSLAFFSCASLRQVDIEVPEDINKQLDIKDAPQDKQKEDKEIKIAAIIQRYDYDHKTHSLKIKFNPDFFAFFLESMLTGINFTLRRQLKKDGSKAIMRFLATHTNPKRMHILTVLKAINYNIDQPMYRLRSRVKEFIKELKKNKVLGSKTKLYSDDAVYFDVLPRKKILPD